MRAWAQPHMNSCASTPARGRMFAVNCVDGGLTAAAHSPPPPLPVTSMRATMYIRCTHVITTTAYACHQHACYNVYKMHTCHHHHRLCLSPAMYFTMHTCHHHHRLCTSPPCVTMERYNVLYDAHISPPTFPHSHRHCPGPETSCTAASQSTASCSPR